MSRVLFCSKAVLKLCGSPALSPVLPGAMSEQGQRLGTRIPFISSCCVFGCFPSYKRWQQMTLGPVSAGAEAGTRDPSLEAHLAHALNPLNRTSSKKSKKSTRCLPFI